MRIRKLQRIGDPKGSGSWKTGANLRSVKSCCVAGPGTACAWWWRATRSSSTRIRSPTDPPQTPPSGPHLPFHTILHAFSLSYPSLFFPAFLFRSLLRLSIIVWRLFFHFHTSVAIFWGTYLCYTFFIWNSDIPELCMSVAKITNPRCFCGVSSLLVLAFSLQLCLLSTWEG